MLLLGLVAALLLPTFLNSAVPETTPTVSETEAAPESAPTAAPPTETETVTEETEPAVTETEAAIEETVSGLVAKRDTLLAEPAENVLVFPDILGFCQTPHSEDEKRNTNLRLACAAINGVVLQPGDVLSYNETLGQRTEERGYLPAPAYSGTDLVDSLGGGICQVSSTLYLCSLYAGLETVERVSHGYPSNYMPIGLDATVSWGSPDLKIRNDSEYPVKIVAEEQNGFVCVWIMGTEVRDYYIRMGFGSSGTYAKSTICKYDRQTNELISKEDHLYSAYLDEVDSVIGEIGPEQIYRWGLSREQAIPDPTPETLEAAERCIAPNAFA